VVTKGFKFYGCSNFAYGCQYSKTYNPEDDPVKMAKEQIVKTIDPSKPLENLRRLSSTKPQSAPKHTPSVPTGSKLTHSQRNRLSYFVANPTLYAGSPKARDKVKELEVLKPEFTLQEAQQFLKAHDIWKKGLK
jgi:hypothetical protein